MHGSGWLDIHIYIDSWYNCTVHVKLYKYTSNIIMYIHLYSYKQYYVHPVYSKTSPSTKPLVYFYQPPLIQETNCQEIWYATAHNIPPKWFFSAGWWVLDFLSISFRIGIQPTLAILQGIQDLFLSFGGKSDVSVAKKQKAFWNSYLKQWLNMPVGFGGYVGDISKPPLMFPCQAFSSESIFSLKPLLSPEPSVAERMEWM